jgi:NADH-quinone oxidoreductase subunit G
MATIVIDDKTYHAEKGKNLLETSLSLGLDLPYFCWHPAMGSVGACRQCAVKKFKDKEDTQGKIVMACMEPVAEEARISIDDPEARRFRKQVIESLMTNHPHDCPTCDEGGECHLQDMTVMTGHNYRRYRFNKRTYRNQFLGPFLNHEMNRCIQCYRCVRFYKDYAGGKDLDVFGAHNHVYFGRAEDGALENEFSGNLVEVCPTGVFTDKTLKKQYTRKWDLTHGPSICHQCSLGCNIIGGERYGSLRRILSRYNGEVNGYFICDRGRFGYEFVNGEDRMRLPFAKRNGLFEAVSPKAALTEAAALLAPGKKVIGIGSPRASLESNFALKSLVGADHFYLGQSHTDDLLSRKALKILQSIPVRTPSMKEMEKSDAILILGEDVTNSAPMMALALRQAARGRHFDRATTIGIDHWNDQAVREAAQGAQNPLFIAMSHATPLDDAAQKTCFDHPDNLARLGFSVAAKIDPEAPAPSDLPAAAEDLAEQIAASLSGAERPLIISGGGLQTPAILEAAANIALALHRRAKTPLLSLIFSEANSVGLSLLGGKPLEDAFSTDADAVIILENDLFRRASEKNVKQLLEKTGRVLTLDHIHTPTADFADLVLPAGAFAESGGTLVSQEGRAQRFYQVYVPYEPIRESWRWLVEIGAMTGREKLGEWTNLDKIASALARSQPIFQTIDEIAPPASFRVQGQAIARQPKRYSGRTAMTADRNPHEPAPPADPDSPLGFSMEGRQGQSPSATIPFFWSPGWNSAQSINKYQIEVGGPLHDGDPGKRLFEPVTTAGRYYETIPERWGKTEGVWRLAPIHHIFGSEETSALAPAVKDRSPAPYLALHPEDADVMEVKEDDRIRVELPDGAEHYWPVRLLSSLPAGLAGFPHGLPKMPFLEGLSRVRLSKVKE